MSSSLAPSLTAQQQVLEVVDLLREVLACLGTDVAKCHAALLVSRFWFVALDRYVFVCLGGCICGAWRLRVDVCLRVSPLLTPNLPQHHQ